MRAAGRCRRCCRRARSAGRRRPIGIVLGLAVTFTIAIVALAQLVKGVGLASGAARTLAIVVLIGFGVVLLIPELAERIQAPLSRLARFGPKTRGDGFWSGVAVGGALGFVCAPCAGPILAAVTSVSASSGATAQVRAGRDLLRRRAERGDAAVRASGAAPCSDRIRRRARGHVVERSARGRAAAHRRRDGDQPRRPLRGDAGQGHQPAGDPRRPDPRARELERGPEPARLAAPAVAVRRSASAKRRSRRSPPGGRLDPGGQDPTLPNLGAAPDFTNTQQWFNTPGDRPLTMAGLRGHVVLVDFWTYTCINCIRTLPFLKGLYATYHRYGLDIVGVETPEFTFEQEAGNVQQAIHSDGLHYPVVQDNRYGTWNAYQNEYWPAEYLIDAKGQVRHTQFGEGDYKQDEAAVRELLYEAGARQLPPPMTAQAIMPSSGLGTPETYLDPQRAQGFAQPLTVRNRIPTRASSSLQRQRVRAQGTWNDRLPVGHAAGQTGAIDHRRLPGRARLPRDDLDRQHAARRCAVLLDGQPISAADSGADVHGGLVTVRASGCTRWSRCRRPSSTTSRSQIPPGVSAYDFTFG